MLIEMYSCVASHMEFLLNDPTTLKSAYKNKKFCLKLYLVFGS